MFPNQSNHQSPEFTEADFIKFSRLVYDQSGISLSESKKELVKARLGKRIRKGKFQSFGAYYNHVINDQSGEEMILLLDSISTNFTHFFRENHHFEYLKNQLVPQIKDRAGRAQKKSESGARAALQGKNPIPSPLPCWSRWVLAMIGI